MEWHSPFTDQIYYHPYASTGIDNNILDFDTENVAKLMPGKSAAAVDATTARINQHYVKSQRHIKRAFGSKMVENFQEYNWGLVLNVEQGLARDKIELLNLALSSDSESKLSEKEFYKVITHHTSYRKLAGRRKKVIFRDMKTCFKKFSTKPPYSPYIVTKHDVLEILDMTGIELDIDFDRLVRTMRASDAEHDRMHMLLMDDPLISGKISESFVHSKPTHRFRIPVGSVHSVGDEPLQWVDSDDESEAEDPDPMAAFEESIAQEEEEYGRLYEEMIKKQKEKGEEVAAPSLNMDEGDEDASPEKAKKPEKKVVGGKTKFDMYNTAAGGPRKGTKRPVQHVSKPDPAVEALFSKVPKSAAAAAAAAQGNEKPTPKKGGVRHRIAMAHAYGKKEAEKQRVELFIPNLPFARKSIPDKDMKSAVEDVLSEADREIHAEIELARRYAFEKETIESEEVITVASSKPPEMDASNSTCYPSSALVAPLDGEAKQSQTSKATSAVADGSEKPKRPLPKKRDLFGQKSKAKKEFILDTGPAPKPKPSTVAKKSAPPKQVAFNETVVVDEISLVGADEASVTSSITRDDSIVYETEYDPKNSFISKSEGVPRESVLPSETAEKKQSDDPKRKRSLNREKTPSKKVPLKDKCSATGPERADHTSLASESSPTRIASSASSQPLQRPSTVTHPSSVEASSSLTEICDKPFTAPTISQKKECTEEPERKGTSECVRTPRTEDQEEDDAVKFLELLDEQAQRVSRAPEQRPQTAVPQKVPAYVSKLRGAARPKTAPEKSAVLTPVEAEEYASFLDLLENYPGELTAGGKAAPLAARAVEAKPIAQDVAVAPLPLPETVGLANARPKSSGRTRTPILLSPRSQDIVDRPPKFPSPRAFEVLDLPEPILVPFPLIQLYSMPAQDIELMVPKTNGQLRLQIRHDDEGDIHGLFVHGFRPNCKAEERNLIKVGDELLKVNGHVVKGGYLEDVVTALRFHDSDVVPMVIRRHDVPTIDQSPADYSYDPGVVGNDDESPRPFTVSNQPFVEEEDDFPSLFDLFTLPAQDIEIMVPKTNGQLRIQLRHDDEGDIHGLFVHGFRPFSKAEEQGLIRVADEIIKVNGVIVKGGYLEDVVEILKDHEANSVPIVVRRYSAEKRPGSRCSQLEHYRVEDVSPRPFEVTNFVGAGGSFPPLEVLFQSPSKDIKLMVPKTNGQLRVQLRHDDEGELHGLFVHGFRPYSKAEEQGLLKVGDEVFKVNGVFVKGGYLEDVVAALEDHTDDLVDITVRRHFPRKK